MKSNGSLDKEMMLTVVKEWWKHYDLETIIKLVCSGPKAFVDNDDFFTVVAFIDGFAYSNKAFHDEMIDFSVWLSEKLDLHYQIVWFSKIVRQFPDKDDALRELPKLYEEFKLNKISS